MRPYISKSIDELEKIFEESGGEALKLKILRGETKYRSTPRGKKLHEKVLTALQATPIDPRKASTATRLGTAKAPERTTPTSSVAMREGRKSADQPKNYPKKMAFKPTDEQHDCIAKFGTVHSLKINAFAGAGKTSTLCLLADSTSRKGIYLAFNRAARIEARQKFPRNVQCSTTHSLAFWAMRGRYSIEKLIRPTTSVQLAEALGFRDINAGDRKIRARSLGFLVKETLRRFMHSTHPTPDHAAPPRLQGFATLPDEAWLLAERFVKEQAKRAWSRMCDANDSLSLGHDGYLKLWALGRPKMEVDYILLDEAQDTNPVVLEVLQDQAAHAQLVYVGDKHQQIYEWRGAVNAMSSIYTETQSNLTTSFRFGPEIAAAATSVLRNLGEEATIKGNPQNASTIGRSVPADAILARTNGETISELIAAIEDNKTPHLVGGTDDLKTLVQGVQDLKRGEPSTAPELVGYANWSEVVEGVNNGEAEHLKSLVTLVETRSEKQILWALGRTVDADKANIIISTAHKAKGLEWRNVRLAEDFSRLAAAGASGKNKVGESEARLFYVAMTRAKQNLDIDPATLAFFTRPRRFSSDIPNSV